MKIGILTVPFNNNYGGFLQAFALKSVLVQMGHDVIFLNRQRDLGKGLKFRVYRSLVKFGIIEDYLKKRQDRISRYTNEFKNWYLCPITEPCYDSKSLEKCYKQEKLDCCIVGSDQVWRYYYAMDSIDDFFLNFVEDEKVIKISYAASFGIDEMDYPEGKQLCIKSLLAKFKAISVREKSGKNIINKYFGISEDKIEVVLDPTMLLGIDKYKNLFNRQSKRDAFPSNYLFSYILDKDQINLSVIEKVRQFMKLKHVDISAETGNVSGINYIEPVEKWLSAIFFADFVVTDSFHGTVFSILFNRPFIVIANPRRGMSRITDLLSRFGLEGRLYNSSGRSNLSHYSSIIDWSDVNKRLDEERILSFDFLNRNLS